MSESLLRCIIDHGGVVSIACPMGLGKSYTAKYFCNYHVYDVDVWYMEIKNQLLPLRPADPNGDWTRHNDTLNLHIFHKICGIVALGPILLLTHSDSFCKAYPWVVIKHYNLKMSLRSHILSVMRRCVKAGRHSQRDVGLAISNWQAVGPSNFEVNNYADVQRTMRHIIDTELIASDDSGLASFVPRFSASMDNKIHSLFLDQSHYSDLVDKFYDGLAIPFLSNSSVNDGDILEVQSGRNSVKYYTIKRADRYLSIQDMYQDLDSTTEPGSFIPLISCLNTVSSTTILLLLLSDYDAGISTVANHPLTTRHGKPKDTSFGPVPVIEPFPHQSSIWSLCTKCSTGCFVPASIAPGSCPTCGHAPPR